MTSDAIAAALRLHEGIREARVRSEGDRIVAEVVPARTIVIEEADHLRDWQARYDKIYEREAGGDPAFNIIGWKSSYSNRPLPDEEMREWVDQTVARITALEPRRVLEIGCGTGLLAARIAPSCERYLATDYSKTAVDYVRTHFGLEAEQRMADGLANAGEFDTIILNSVVQYFPSAAYLANVLAGARALLVPGGRIFVGDVRNLQLLPAFYAAANRIGDLSLEDELVLDPAWFGAAEVRCKRARFINELSQFRYDVVLSDAKMVVPELVPWTTLEAARELATRGTPIRVTGIPNARLGPGIDPELLWELGDVTWSREPLAIDLAIAHPPAPFPHDGPLASDPLAGARERRMRVGRYVLGREIKRWLDERGLAAEIVVVEC